MASLQESIEAFLDAYRGAWFTTMEISVGMSRPYGAIANALMRMRRWKTVEYDPDNHLYRRA